MFLRQHDPTKPPVEITLGDEKIPLLLEHGGLAEVEFRLNLNIMGEGADATFWDLQHGSQFKILVILWAALLPTKPTITFAEVKRLVGFENAAMVTEKVAEVLLQHMKPVESPLEADPAAEAKTTSAPFVEAPTGSQPGPSLVTISDSPVTSSGA